MPRDDHVRVSHKTVRRRGFAYGTLTGHPEQGEESFAIEHRADDSVWGVITAVSRPGRWFVRLGAPVAVVIQYAAVDRYVAALENLARG